MARNRDKTIYGERTFVLPFVPERSRDENRPLINLFRRKGEHRRTCRRGMEIGREEIEEDEEEEKGERRCPRGPANTRR